VTPSRCSTAYVAPGATRAPPRSGDGDPLRETRRSKKVEPSAARPGVECAPAPVKTAIRREPRLERGGSARRPSCSQRARETSLSRFGKLAIVTEDARKDSPHVRGKSIEELALAEAWPARTSATKPGVVEREGRGGSRARPLRRALGRGLRTSAGVRSDPKNQVTRAGGECPRIDRGGAAGSGGRRILGVSLGRSGVRRPKICPVTRSGDARGLSPDERQPPHDGPRPPRLSDRALPRRFLDRGSG